MKAFTKSLQCRAALTFGLLILSCVFAACSSNPATPATQVDAIEGSYYGNIDNSLGISSTGGFLISQPQLGEINGSVVILSPLEGSGPFIGTYDSIPRVQFTNVYADGSIFKIGCRYTRIIE